MLRAIYEGIPADRYALDSNLLSTASISDSGNASLGLQYPYGQGGQSTSGFQAGVIGQLANDGNGNTIVQVASGFSGYTFAPAGIIADSFTDCIKSGHCTLYQGFGVYETDQIASSYSTPAVNDPVTASQDGKGTFIKATVGTAIIGYVEEIKHNEYAAPLGSSATVITVRLLGGPVYLPANAT